jgi:hypothetical protein
MEPVPENEESAVMEQLVADPVIESPAEAENSTAVGIHETSKLIGT